MIGQRSIVLVFLLCFIAESKSQQQQTAPVCNGTNQKLMNTVVDEGSLSSFSNQPDPVGVKWEYVPSGSNQSTPIADNGTLEPTLTDYYAVDATHLNITTVSTGEYRPTATAGLYTVTYKTGGCQSMANVIVLPFGPVCYCTPTDPYSVNAQLTCHIYYGVNPKYPNQPKIIWINNCGQTFNGTETITAQNAYTYHFSSSISIKRSAFDKFTCAGTFAQPDPSAPPNMATNAPSYNASCIAKGCES